MTERYSPMFIVETDKGLYARFIDENNRLTSWTHITSNLPE